MKTDPKALIAEVQKAALNLDIGWPYGHDVTAFNFTFCIAPNCAYFKEMLILAEFIKVHDGRMKIINPFETKPDIPLRTIPTILIYKGCTFLKRFDIATGLPVRAMDLLAMDGPLGPSKLNERYTKYEEVMIAKAAAVQAEIDAKIAEAAAKVAAEEAARVKRDALVGARTELEAAAARSEISEPLALALTMLLNEKVSELESKLPALKEAEPITEELKV